MVSINDEIMGLYNDPVYQELNEYYSKTTIFNILGIERNENRHSSFLRWLLDNRSSHGLGDEPMKKFLRLYASKMKDGEENEFRVMLLSGNYTINIENLVTEQAFTGGRMDIYGEMVLKGCDGDSDESKKVFFVMENKIYSGERDRQTLDYHEEILRRKGDGIPVEVFLTPKNASKNENESHYHDGVEDVGGPQCKDFKHVFYSELLNGVILPISKMTMPAESLQIILDYIRVLGKPSISDDKKKGYSIIATSDDEKNKLIEIHKNHRELFRQVLFAGIDKNSDDIEKKNLPLLHALWNSNVDLFKAILNCLNKDEIKELGVNKEKIIKESNRDTSKYIITVNGIPYDKKALFKNRAALAIFKAYVELHPEVTLKELRKRFPCNEINKYYSGSFYKFMFYNVTERNTLKFDVDHPKLRKNEEGKAGDVGVWDFFVDEADLLQLSDCKAMVVKMWRKNDFDRLLEYIRNIPDGKEIKVVPVE